MEAICFYNCKNLKKVIIPENIKYIGSRAFFEENDSGIDGPGTKEVIFEGNKEDIELGENCFDQGDWLPFN